MAQGCTNCRAAAVITDKMAVWGAAYFWIGIGGRFAIKLVYMKCLQTYECVIQV